MAEEKKLEKDIQREICEWLQLQGYFFWRSNNVPVFGMNNGGKRTFRALPKFTPRGLPDIMVIVAGGRFLALEVKRPGQALRPEQAEFGMKCEMNGAHYKKVTCLGDVEDYFLAKAKK